MLEQLVLMRVLVVLVVLGLWVFSLGQPQARLVV
jgi:hypothetical protein